MKQTQNETNSNKIFLHKNKMIYINTYKKIEQQQLKHRIILINIKYMLIFIRKYLIFFYQLKLKLLNLSFLIEILQQIYFFHYE